MAETRWPPQGEDEFGLVIQHLEPDGYMVWNGYPVMAYTDGGEMISVKEHTGKAYADDQDYRTDPLWKDRVDTDD